MHGVRQRTNGRSIVTAESARALLLDPGAREIFGRPARLASLGLRAPIAMVGVLHPDRVTLVGQVGVPRPWSVRRELPLESTFCRYVADTRSVFVIEDAARHPLGFAITPLEGFPRVAYCGAPIIIEGQVIAVLSAADVQPRRWSQDELTLLRELATAIQRDLELLGSRFEWRAAAPIAPVEAAPDGLMTVDAQWRLSFMNDHAQKLLGRSEEDVLGRRFWHVYPGLVGTSFHRECLRVTADRMPVEQEIHCRSIDRWLEVRGYPTADGGAALHLRDISARRNAQEELRTREARYRRLFEDARTPFFLMDRDGTLLEVNQSFENLPLTGLPNRVVFMDRLDRLLRHSKRRAGDRFAVLFLDLDNFKLVNDTHGHIIGDQLLVAVARRLEACVRQEDTVARIGGDEFGAARDDPGRPTVTLVVDRIREASPSRSAAEVAGHGDDGEHRHRHERQRLRPRRGPAP
jgi:diguanylate cyclase (GGDEF)-like protein/PAS domain S-box-containing protein